MGDSYAVNFDGIITSPEPPNGRQFESQLNRVSAGFANVSVWFSSTGRTVAGIKKLAPGTYQYLPPRSYAEISAVYRGAFLQDFGKAP